MSCCCFSSVVFFFFFFFLKQKTAYEISTRDWSSDVCSSDLGELVALPAGFGEDAAELAGAEQQIVGPLERDARGGEHQAVEEARQREADPEAQHFDCGAARGAADDAEPE